MIFETLGGVNMAYGLGLFQQDWWICANGCGLYVSKRLYPTRPPRGWVYIRTLGWCCPHCARWAFRTGLP